LGTPDGPAERLAGAVDPERPTALDVEAVERVFPHLVLTADDGSKTIAYEGLIGALIEAVKELDSRLSALEASSEAERPDREPPPPGQQQ
jgi:hypothetical protein